MDALFTVVIAYVTEGGLHPLQFTAVFGFHSSYLQNDSMHYCAYFAIKNFVRTMEFCDERNCHHSFAPTNIFFLVINRSVADLFREVRAKISCYIQRQVYGVEVQKHFF